MLPAYVINIAIVLRLLAGASYMRATLQGKAQPNLVSWSCWSLTGLIAFAVQLIRGSGPEAFVTLTIALSPLAVCAAAVYKGMHRIRLTRLDAWCLGLTGVGIALWLISSNPLMALAMSIIADLCSNVPTLVKCYLKPHTEQPAAYGISVISMGITLLAVTDWRVTNWLFPLYILCINATLFLTATALSRLRGRWLRLLPVSS